MTTATDDEGRKVAIDDVRLDILTSHPRLLRGNAIFEDYDEESSVWGPADYSLWSKGESLMLFGPPSLGKTTLAQRMALARIGLVDSVLGYSVDDDGGNLLYLAMDRPKQIKRSMYRMCREVTDRLYFLHGTLPVPITTNTHWLANDCEAQGITTVVVDSIKDAISNPSDEVMAGKYHEARSHCLERGIEWLEIHHNRKATNDGKTQRDLDAVYGSRWLTAGAGSVLSLHGIPGDHDVEITQLKSPTDRHRSMDVWLDTEHGDLALIQAQGDVLSALRAAGSEMSAIELSEDLHGPDAEQQVKQVRVQLTRLYEKGMVRRYGERRNYSYSI